MPSSKSRYCLRISVEVFLLIAVVTGIFLVKKLWPPFQRGMYCFDGSLTYPFRDYDTISDSLLLFYGVAIPLNVNGMVGECVVKLRVLLRHLWQVCDWYLEKSLPFPSLFFYNLVQPYQRGLFCDDESIRYPYYPSTVTWTTVCLVGIFLPTIVMCLVEFLRVRREIIGKEFGIFGRKFSSWLWAIYCSVGVFLFGCGCSQLLTDVAKYSLGFLRPHFIDVCKPDWSQMNCTNNWPLYVDPVPCTTDDVDKLKDARMSFPSGHASFSTYTMLYLVIYLQARLTIHSFRLVKPVLQLICLLLNLFTCYTRIADYKHHPSDVIGGFILGGTVALLIAFFVSDLFTKKTSRMCKNTAVMLQEYQPPMEEAHTNSNAHNP